MTRFGILGFGHHAVRRLMPGFAGAREAKPTGLWRRDAAKATANAREYLIPHVFDTPDALCASPEIDAVFVVSPDALHLEDVLTAVRHGKHVLCEKPLAMNAGQVEQMLSATERAGVKFGVAQNMRYNRTLALMRQWIAEGRIGKPVFAQSQFAYFAAGSPRSWIYDPSLALGGPIGDVGIHCVDALRYVLGGGASTKVTAVNTLAHKDADSGAVESHAVVALDFASGAMASVTVTTRSRYRTLVEVTGENGVILCENGLTVDFPVEVLLRRGDQIEERVTLSNADAYSRMLDGFSRWIEGRVEYLSPAREEGLHNQRVMDAAYQSWREGCRVTVS
ncbi:MAG TPA: Gfo/Idh/MocA family oxidoreductase [Acidobacteriaceae bacterium]|nr:Gfo/Idh/MocA family oxidoreductase [Acidobacteriaceae bacterium]